MSRSLLRGARLAAGAGLAVLTLTGCGRSSPENLAIGDCIDVPASDSIGSIPKRSCTEAHAGEVFHMFDAPGTIVAYPADPEWGPLIYPVCDPAFEAYTGTPVEERTDIDYRYFVPTSDGWASGDREVTCFIVSLGGDPLTRSYRAGGG
jgi:hypothetical protein